MFAGYCRVMEGGEAPVMQVDLASFPPLTEVEGFVLLKRCVSLIDIGCLFVGF